MEPTSPRRCNAHTGPIGQGVTQWSSSRSSSASGSFSGPQRSCWARRPQGRRRMQQPNARYLETTVSDNVVKWLAIPTAHVLAPLSNLSFTRLHAMPARFSRRGEAIGRRSSGARHVAPPTVRAPSDVHSAVCDPAHQSYRHRSSLAMKMGTIASPWCYDAVAISSLQSTGLRPPAICASPSRLAASRSRAALTIGSTRRR